jgi:hypothetical protein
VTSITASPTFGLCSTPPERNAPQPTGDDHESSRARADCRRAARLCHQPERWPVIDAEIERNADD